MRLSEMTERQIRRELQSVKVRHFHCRDSAKAAKLARRHKMLTDRLADIQSEGR